MDGSHFGVRGTSVSEDPRKADGRAYEEATALQAIRQAAANTAEGTRIENAQRAEAARVQRTIEAAARLDSGRREGKKPAPLSNDDIAQRYRLMPKKADAPREVVQASAPREPRQNGPLPKPMMPPPAIVRPMGAQQRPAPEQRQQIVQTRQQEPSRAQVAQQAPINTSQVDNGRQAALLEQQRRERREAELKREAVGRLIVGDTHNEKPHAQLQAKFDRLFNPATKEEQAVGTFNALRSSLRVLDQAEITGMKAEDRKALERDVGKTLEGIQNGRLATAEYAAARTNVAQTGAREIQHATEVMKDRLFSGLETPKDGNVNAAMFKLDRTAEKAQDFAAKTAREAQLQLRDADLNRWVRDLEIRDPQKLLLPERQFSLSADVIDQSARMQGAWKDNAEAAAFARDRDFLLRDEHLASLAAHLRQPDVNKPVLADYIDSNRQYREACRQRDIATDRSEMLRKDPGAADNQREIQKTFEQIRELNADVREAKGGMEKAWTAYRKSPEQGPRKYQVDRWPLANLDKGLGRGEDEAEGQERGRREPVHRPDAANNWIARGQAVSEAATISTGYGPKV